jgi:4-amino-4-deoxy-L-arabinose transferase-like glycosyltransferase
LGLLATPLWGLVGIAAVYFLTRSLFDRRAALLAAVLLGMVILQNWFARYPTAEVLTQAYLYAGLYALSRVLRQHEAQRSWGFLAGLWMGLIFLTRIDMILVLVLLPIPLIALAAMRRWTAGLTSFVLTFGLLLLQSVIHAVVFAWPYTYNTYLSAGTLLLGRSGAVWLGAGLAGVVLLFVGARFINQVGEERRVQWTRWLSIALIMLVCSAALYAYFLRPLVESATTGDYWYGDTQITSTNRENLVRIGWYVTPLGLAITLLGLCLIIWRERSLPVQLFVAIGLLSAAAYVINILNNPHHIYAMRRYVPVVIPAMMIWGAYGLAAISRKRWRGARLATGLVLLAWLGGMIWQSRVIWRQVDYAGAIAALTQLDRKLAPGAIVLFDDQSPVGVGDVVGTPLRFIFDHPVFVLRDPAATTPEALRALILSWQQQGHSVYVLSEASRDVSLKAILPLSEAQQFTFDTTVLLPTYTDYPNQVVPLLYNLKAQAIQPLR